MAEENQVEPQGEAAQAQQITKEPQQVTKEPQRVTTKNPKKVEAGKRLAESNRKKERSEEKRTSEIGGQQSKPILWHRSCYSSGSYRWSWLLHLSN